MADDADRASIQQQNLVDAAINQLTFVPINTNNLSGVCWNCGKTTGKHKRWCNKTCCEEWEQG